MNIDWIFFDIGGTLADERAYSRWRQEVDLRVAQQYRPEITQNDLLAAITPASRRVGFLGENILRVLLEDQSNETIEEAINVMNQEMAQGPHYIDLEVIRPEAREVLETLASRYHLGIIANQPSEIKIKLESAGLMPYLSSCLVSADLDLGKPNPEYFKEVFRQTGALPERSAMIDDNIERGLKPAKELGMTTVWYNEQEKVMPEQAVDFIAADLRELVPIFK